MRLSLLFDSNAMLLSIPWDAKLVLDNSAHDDAASTFPDPPLRRRVVNLLLDEGAAVLGAGVDVKSDRSGVF